MNDIEWNKNKKLPENNSGSIYADDAIFIWEWGRPKKNYEHIDRRRKKIGLLVN